MNNIKLGFAICGSFCTIANALKQIEHLKEKGYDVYPIVSQVVYSTNTRFTNSKDLINKLEEITGHTVIHTIEDAEPIGPKKMFDILTVCPCTGNTLAKLALGITDTPVTMAVKSHIRNNRPVVLAIASNDALGASAKNIGYLLNTKNFYFVPFSQDDPFAKQRSMIADFDLLYDSITNALNQIQIEPIIK